MFSSARTRILDLGKEYVGSGMVERTGEDSNGEAATIGVWRGGV